MKMFALRLKINDTNYYVPKGLAIKELTPEVLTTDLSQARVYTSRKVAITTSEFVGKAYNGIAWTPEVVTVNAHISVRAVDNEYIN